MTKNVAFFAVLLFYSCSSKTTIQSSNGVSWTGAMSRVMHKGELNAVISFDTVDKAHLYGIGPTEGLESEIMIIDGISYVSTVISDSVIDVAVKDAKAPFFVFARIENWEEMPLPDSIVTIEHLNKYLDVVSATRGKPFFFKIITGIDSARIHIVNLSKGSKVKSPKDAHKDMEHYSIYGQNAALLGVYSTEHAGIFVHHDSHTHIHLITEDKSMMGHLENISLKNGATLYLQEK